MVAGSVGMCSTPPYWLLVAHRKAPGIAQNKSQSRADRQEVQVYELYGCYLRGIERGFKVRLHYGRKASSMHSCTSMIKERPELKGQYHTRAALVRNWFHANSRNTPPHRISPQKRPSKALIVRSMDSHLRARASGGARTLMVGLMSKEKETSVQ